MDKIIFISAQPDITYFHWQVEVFINNAISVGLNPNWIEILFSYDNEISDYGKGLIDKYPYVNFFFYKRSIDFNNYIPSIRPDIISQHFKIFKHLEKKTIFYHDSDIIFRELPNFKSLTNDDTWYFSNTNSYISSDYIKSKSINLFSKMCEIANIDQNLVEYNNENSGGAQYLIKGVDYKYWQDVTKVSIDLYNYMDSVEKKERSEMGEEELKLYNPIQKWCADMWAVFWCGLKINKSIEISKELDFSWASSNIEDWYNNKIYHNAGITDNKDYSVFCKSDYINVFPWDVDFSKIDKKSNTINYINNILLTKEIKGYNELHIS